jgi:serine-type D-Ala-D-Ala carboxypeptidase/endopeptidase (penicillin-binding protein 4)
MLRAVAFLSVLLASATARGDLASDVHTILANPAISKAEVGVQIVKLGTSRDQDQTLVAVNADAKLIPASNLKIITTALALDTLGTDFRFRTRFAINGTGDVALVGDGDPTFGDSEYLEATGWTSTTVFEHWAAELKKNGVTHVNDVIVDDSIFDDQFFNPNWPVNQAHLDYVAQVAGMNFNANCLDVYAIRNGGTASYRFAPTMKYATVTNELTVGSSHSLYLSRVLGSNKVILKGTINATNRKPFRVTIDDPPMFAATTLAEVLERQGVHVAGKAKRDRTVRTADASAWKTVAVHETPLLPMLALTNKDSINLYAESLGKRAAAELSKQPGSWKGLAEAQVAFMKTVGAPADDYAFDDGCGLSKENGVAPAAFVATLAHEFHSDHREQYVATMAVGGVDGTLSNRYKTDKDKPNALAGRVFAKSGSVNGVSTLSGYLKSQTGDWFAFSILVNKIGDRGAAQKTQDDIVRAIDATTR